MSTSETQPRAIASDPVGRYLVPVIALLAAQFAVALVPFGVGPLAPYLRQVHDLERSQVGMASGLIFAAVAACSVPAGRLTDRIGVPRAIVASTSLVALGAVGAALFGAPVALGASLLVIGAGYSLISPATNKGVIGATPRPRRGRAMGVKQMGVTLGAAVAAATLPAGVDRFGLETTLVLAAAAVAVTGAAAAAAFRLTGRRPAEGGTDVSAPGRPDRARRRRILRLGGAVGGMVAAQHVVATYLALFLVERRGMRPLDAAGLLTVLHGSGTVARLTWGWISDRLARLTTIIVIGSTSVVSLGLLASVGPVLPTAALVSLVAVLGAATQGGNAVYQVAIAEEDVARAGWASGVGMTLGFTGAIVAPPAFGWLVDATGSYATGFVVTAFVVAAAVAVVAGLRSRRAAGGSEPPDHP